MTTYVVWLLFFGIFVYGLMSLLITERQAIRDIGFIIMWVGVFGQIATLYNQSNS